MGKKRVLFISSQGGFGHIFRDIAIARELRRRNPEVEIVWLAIPFSITVLEEACEKLLPETDQLLDTSTPSERVARGFSFNIFDYVSNSKKEWEQNLKVTRQVIDKERFDLIIGDETFEILIEMLKDPDLLGGVPFVLIVDFIQADAMTGNPFEKLGIYLLNRIVSRAYKLFEKGKVLGLFVGEMEDVEDKPLGFLLRNCREFIQACYKPIGFVFPEDIDEYADRERARSELGYGSEPLVVCSIGGTAIGKDLLNLCGRAFPIIREKIPDLRMVLVCGPRLDPESLDVPDEVEVRGYVPALYKHHGACDLAIVQGGGTTTAELTALRRPFLYFPLETHFEQRLHVTARLARHRAGVQMEFSETTLEILAERVVAHLGKEVDYAPIPADGAQKAVKIIGQLL